MERGRTDVNPQKGGEQKYFKNKGKCCADNLQHTYMGYIVMIPERGIVTEEM